MTQQSTAQPPGESGDLFPSIADEIRVLIVAGVAYGAVVAGLGSRLAMLLLRVTSPDSVNGVQSDDDFTIGTFTIGGTYNLLLLGAVVGMVGAGAYRLVRPWLIGPTWFRRVTTGLAAGAVVGSMLVHADGIDFRVLKPTWFAIGLFVLLPGVFGTFIGPIVDRVASDDSWTRHGHRRWALPVVSLLMFPPSIVIVPFAAVLATALLACREVDGVERVRASLPYGLAVRALWLGVALLGLVALLGDIVDVSRAV
jgi:hypothetical protein